MTAGGMAELLWGLVMVAGAIVSLALLGGLRPAPGVSPEQPIGPPLLSLDGLLPEWPRVYLVRDCEHDWEVIREDNPLTGGLKRCRLCGTSTLTFRLGDIEPGGVRHIPIDIRDLMGEPRDDA